MKYIEIIIMLPMADRLLTLSTLLLLWDVFNDERINKFMDMLQSDPYDLWIT